MLALHELLRDLAVERPVFHSEADFQHAFAWLLHQRHPELSLRLELPVRIGDAVLHMDILGIVGDKRIAIELKYKTKALALAAGGEEFRLANHGAQDLGRYDFIKDIHRLERLTAADQRTSGYAVLLTNDSSYWTQARDSESVDAAFRLHIDRVLSGSLSWDVRAAAGTIRGRNTALDLTGSYPVGWRDYSQLPVNRCGVLKYLAVEVGGGTKETR